MSSVKKNFAYQTIYQILIIILPLFTSPYISRILGVNGVGKYSYTYSIAYYFGVFILLGVNTYGTREIAKCNKDKEKITTKFWSIYVIQFLCGIVLTCIYFIYALSCLNRNMAIILTLYIVSVILDINWFFFGIEKFKVTVTRNVIIKIASVVSIFLFVNKREDLLVYTFIMAISAFTSQVVLWGMLFKEIKICFPEKSEIINSIKPMIVFFIPTIIVSVYKIMDKIMIGSIASTDQLAFYENSDKIMSIPLGVITALGTIMMPRISRMLEEGKGHKIEVYIRNSMKFSMFSACALAFGLAAVGPDFAPIFWGSEFKYSGELIVYLSITVIFISWANVLRTQYLIPFGFEKIFIYSSAVGAIINFVINMLLIPKLGAMGAVYGTIAAEFSVACYQTIKVRKKLPVKLFLKDNIFYFMNAIIMFSLVQALSFCLDLGHLKLIFEIMVGGIYYLFTCLLYNYLIKDNRILRRKR